MRGRSGILAGLLALSAWTPAAAQSEAEARAIALADRARREGFGAAAGLAPLLDHEEWTVRWHAARGIGLAGADWLDERLALLLDDGRVAPMAAYAIGQVTEQGGRWPPLDRQDDLVAAARAWWRRQKETGEGWVTHDAALSPDLGTIVFGQMHAERGSSWLVVGDAAKDVERGRLKWSGPARAIAFSGDSRTFAVSDDRGSVHVLSTGARTVLHAWPGHRGWILALALSDDGSALASSAEDGTRVRSVETGLDLRERSAAPMTALAFLPGSRTLAGARAGGDLVLAGAGGAADTIASGLARVADLACSPDGRLLATLHADGELVLWDLEARRSRWKKPAHGPRPRAVAIDGGRSVVTAGSDRRVRVWSIADGALLADLACDRNVLAVRRGGDDLIGVHADGGVWRGRAP